jgi:hypothetical protein
MKCPVKIDGGLTFYNTSAFTGVHMGDICIKAGKHVFEMIQDGGFDLSRITTYVGPGAGPKWLIAAGFDLTLLKNEVLGGDFPVMLAGSSAGALRFAAWTQPEFEKSYRKLMESYISMTFSRRDNSSSILRAISNVINDYIEDDALPFALSNKRYRLVVMTVRARNLTASEISLIQGLGLGAAFLFNAFSRSGIHLFFQRVVFYNGPIPPQFCLDSGFKGAAIPLDAINFKHALMASSAIPLVVAGVRDIYGAQNGIYRDGGLTDYHLNQRYIFNKDNVVLLFNHQERIVPGWMDKKLKYRKPLGANQENLLMVYPSEDFIQKLPGGKVPDRHDFKTFARDPGTRIANWREAVRISESLGESFLELIESNRIRGVVEKL